MKSNTDEAKVVRLEQNYRSTQNILDAANAVIRNNKVRKEKNLWTNNGEGSRIEIYTADNEEGEAAHVADTILESVDGRLQLCRLMPSSIG